MWASVPDNNEDDVEAAVRSSVAAFQSYKKVNPRQRAQWLLRWDALIRENKEDLAKILTYETGKPISEAIGEIDYALTFTWWFAGEAERIFGTVQTAAAPGRRTFTIKQPVGVTAALVPWNFPVCILLFIFFNWPQCILLSPRSSHKITFLTYREGRFSCS
jgi:succinate-semialdehyde dehydrogenase / glutarate-semialdehyde dehydrogenase